MRKNDRQVRQIVTPIKIYILINDESGDLGFVYIFFLYKRLKNNL